MTIYTLYIKTHKITGLKYLGQTSHDPFKYLGSGKDWLPHLEKYGKDHYTEILRECQSKKELSLWGRYYSRYYNILKEQDDYGNKIWANKKIECGDGGAYYPGVSTPDHVRKKLSISNTGLKRSDETKANIRAARSLQTNISNQYIKGTCTVSPRKGNSKENDLGYKTVSEKLTGRDITWGDKLSEAARNRPRCSCLVCHRVLAVGSPTAKHWRKCPNPQSL